MLRGFEIQLSPKYCDLYFINTRNSLTQTLHLETI